MARDRRRLDLLLVERGLVETRTQARGAIMAGLVTVDGRREDKPGAATDVTAELVLTGPARTFVSRGGDKLQGAHRAFAFEPAGRICLDCGASTGGFTDFLLRHGAARVYAVDVGYGQLAWNLRQDPRVVVMERTNLRHLTPDGLTMGLPDLAVLDLSFISLGKVLPALAALMAPVAEIVALVKPQFEAGPSSVGKGGVVRDPATHRLVLATVAAQAAEAGFVPVAATHSPVRGPSGNIEFFLHCRRGTAGDLPLPDATLAATVKRAHDELGPC